MKAKKWIGIGVLVVVIVALVAVYSAFGAKPVEGSKAVTIEVINSAGESTMYELKTDAEYLGQAMDETEGLEFVAEDSSFGRVVSAINGEEAVYEADGAYWGFSINGEYCNYGIDEQPIMDGDAIQIAYTK